MLTKSEFASLCDLAIDKGFSHSDLLSEMHERILHKYREVLGDDAQTVEVVIDEATGKVSLMQDSKNVTPKGFSVVAEKLARETLIEKLKELHPGDMESRAKIISEKTGLMEKKINTDGVGRWIMAIIFWGYNFLYFILLLGFFINFFIDESFRRSILDEIRTGGIYRISFIALAWTVPMATIISGIVLVKRKIYNRFAALFFLFEIPLVVISLIFSDLLANASPMMWFIFMIVGFSVPILLISLLSIEARSKKALTAMFFMKQSLFIFFLYLSLLFTFVIPLILGYIVSTITTFFSEALYGVGTSYYHRLDLTEIIYAIFFGGLYLLVILFFASLPFLITFNLGKTFLKSRKDFIEKFGSLFAKKITLITAAVWLIIFVGASYQPNADKLIGQLERLKETTDFNEREAIAKEIMPKEAAVKKAFDNLKYVRQRYLMAKSDEAIKKMYQSQFKMGDLSAELIENAFTFVAYPFVYHGSLDRQNTALNNFEYLFGNSYPVYYDSQVSSIKNVNLLYRKINIETAYDNRLAKVNIEEEFETTVGTDQEVIYEFYLPDDAVVSNLKLGPDLEYQGIIAPRGAALETYQREVRRSRDPALLEQTGPNQYRLRIYPIPRKTFNSIFPGKNQKVSFSYITFVNPEGFKLPFYTKEQNVNTEGKYITASINNIEARVDGNYIKSGKNDPQMKDPCQNREMVSVNTPFNGKIYLASNILAAEVKCSDGKPDMLSAAKDIRFAVLYDISYKNKESDTTGNLLKILEKNQDFLNNNTVDLVKFNDLNSDATKLNKENVKESLNFTYFGKGDWTNAVNAVKGDYDFVILISDTKDPLSQYTDLKRDTPIYLVNENKIMPYVANITGGILQSGGSSFDNIEDALNYALANEMMPSVDGKNYIFGSSSFGYYSDLSYTDVAKSINWQDLMFDKNDFAAVIFARKLLNEEIFLLNGKSDSNIYFKDLTNKYATNNQFVAPYSSLIALVNNTQLQTLENLSQSYDRYKESGSFTATSPQTINLSPPSPFSSGVTNPIFGAPLRSYKISDGGGSSGINLGAPSFSNGVSKYSAISILPFSGLGSGLIMGNILLLSVGGILYLIIRIIKRKKR